MIILGIDPGTTVSGWAMYDSKNKVVQDAGIADNNQLLYGLSQMPADTCAIEIFEARGMPIGNDSIETILFTGQLIQEWKGRLIRVKRSEVKNFLCGPLKAKDSNVRQALIDKLGKPGTKKRPGPTYGVTSHAWAALAVAVTASEK